MTAGGADNARFHQRQASLTLPGSAIPGIPGQCPIGDLAAVGRWAVPIRVVRSDLEGQAAAALDGAETDLDREEGAALE